MKQHAAKGHGSKHAGAHKHASGHAKHHPSKQHARSGKGHQPKSHAVAKHPHHAKARGAQRGTLEVLPPRSGTVAGPRQAPGASLHDLPACPAVAVAASLEMSGHGPVSDSAVLALHRHAGGSDSAAVTIQAALGALWKHGLDGVFPVGHARKRRADIPGSVLGVELPGSHAVCVAACGCWVSWGEHYDPAEFPDAVVEEAWVVRWP